VNRRHFFSKLGAPNLLQLMCPYL